MDKKPLESIKSVDIVENDFAVFRIIRSIHHWENTREEFGDSETLCIEWPALHGKFDENRMFSQPQLKNLFGQQHIHDFYITDIYENSWLFERTNLELFNSFLALLLSTATRAAIHNTNLSRRQFLKTLSSTIGIGYFLINIIPDYLIASGNKSEILTFIQKHNQYYVTYYRNLVMTYKLLSLAEHIYKTTGKKAKIGFPVGGAHGYISELLKIPKSEIKKLIDEVVQELSKKVSKEDLDKIVAWHFTIPHFQKVGQNWQERENIIVE